MDTRKVAKATLPGRANQVTDRVKRMALWPASKSHYLTHGGNLLQGDVRHAREDQEEIELHPMAPSARWRC